MRIICTYKDKESIFDCEKAHIVIGRPKEGVVVDLDLGPDLSVSRPHARIWVEEGEYWIEDLMSMRGTQINAEEIKGKGMRRLNADDTIRLGETTLRVEIPLARAPHGDMRSSKVTIEESPVGITTAMDATVSDFAQLAAPTTDTRRRMALLCELPLEFGAETSVDVLLQSIVRRLVEVIPGAERGALLLQDRRVGELLLKAHLPAGEPAVSMSLARRSMERREGFLWWRGEEATVSQLEYRMECGMYAPLLWKGEVLGVLCVDNSDTRSAFDSDDLRLLLAVAHYAAMAVGQHQLQEDLRRNAAILGRLLTNFSPKIRERLLEKAHHGRLRLGGEKSEVTILCSDIRGFTRLTGGMDAEDIVDMLNDYFSPLVEAIFKYDGTIDKFVGDAILAVFGSPEPDAQQHENAVRAALAMQALMEELNAARAARGQVTCEIGIGVHCGEVLHGFIGSNELMEFTVIGDAVNRAARYTDGALSGEVLASPDVYQRVWKIVQAESTAIKTKHEGELPAFRIKGLKV